MTRLNPTRQIIELSSSLVVPLLLKNNVFMIGTNITDDPMMNPALDALVYFRPYVEEI